MLSSVDRLNLTGAIIILFSMFFLSSSCHDNGAGPRQYALQLSSADVGVTDMTLDLRIDPVYKRREYLLRKDGKDMQRGVITFTDTLVEIDSLLPHHGYSFQLFALANDTATDSSAAFAMTTMDTTNHNFHFEIDTLGDGANSILRDVAIIDNTTAVAVGELYLKDSTGKISTLPYGLAKWNGKKWNLQRIYAPGPNINDYLSVLTPHGIIAFAENDIWFTSGGIFHWNDGIITTYWINSFPGNPNPILNPGQSVEKLWGISSDQIYGVGNQGTIVYFNGSRWKKMESGTDMDLYDVYGSPDGSVVWACGYYYSKAGTYLLRYTKETGWKTAYDGTANEFITRADSLSGMYSTLFAPSELRLFLCSDAGFFEMSSDRPGAAMQYFSTAAFPYFPRRLRGNGVNDLFIVGDYNLLAHFNGLGFHYYREFYNQNLDLNSVDQKENLVIAVGEIYDPINSKGLVIMGKR